MRNIILAAFAALVIGIFGFASEASAGKKCDGRIDVSANCVYNPAPDVSYKGDRNLPLKIKVVVCHPYWNKLMAPKWWGPALASGGNVKKWSKLPAQHSACRVQYIVPGARIGTFTKCLDPRGQWIWTPPMRSSGTYQMT